MITALYAGINGLIMVALAFWVVRNRVRARVGIGDKGDAQLARAIRAHGNNVEYVPYALVLMLLLEITGGAHWWLHVLGVALTVGRLAHGWGLTQPEGESPGRAIGIATSWGVILIAGVQNIVRWIAN